MKQFIVVLLLAGVTWAGDTSVRERIGSDKYHGSCNSISEMRSAALKVSELFNVDIKACNCADNRKMNQECNNMINAFADPDYKGVIWYTDDLVSHVKDEYGRDYESLLELVVAHEVAHLVHFDMGYEKWTTGQTILEPPSDVPTPRVPVPTGRDHSCWYDLFGAYVCDVAQSLLNYYYRILAEQTILEEFLENWQNYFSFDQYYLAHDRKLEMFSDCVAGAYFAQQYNEEEKATKMLHLLIELGEDSDHGTHPDWESRITATYHGVAASHFNVDSIVSWCSILLPAEK